MNYWWVGPDATHVTAVRRSSPIVLQQFDWDLAQYHSTLMHRHGFEPCNDPCFDEDSVAHAVVDAEDGFIYMELRNGITNHRLRFAFEEWKQEALQGRLEVVTVERRQANRVDIRQANKSL